MLGGKTGQNSLTLTAISDLLEEEVTRNVTLQNQAAIVFLLLAHRHGCQEFEGLCCFNITEKSQSIHALISKMRDLVQEIKVDTGFYNIFKEWGLSR